MKMPERIGRYDIVIQIARGGMATVFLARAAGHGGFDRYFALKLTAEHLRDDPEFAEHLVEEAKLVAHLKHQNVVPVLDVGEHDLGAVFLVMDYVPGDSLGGLFKLARARNENVDPRIGLRILIDALAGLHAAHEHCDEEGKPLKLVHRDFSPQNILVGTDGVARLTDFGIAKAASRVSVTLAGTMKGKVSYASPEQAKGAALDRRCDVWAGGVIAWEIFAGRKLFVSNERTLLDVVKGPPTRIRSVMPAVPEEIDEIIAQALAFDVDQRTPTAKQLGKSLEDAARRHGLLAEVEEVAEYVQRMVSPVLEDRKRAIAEAREKRGAQPMRKSDPSFGLGLPGGNKTVPLPSLPVIPVTPLPPEQTLAMSSPPVQVAPPPSSRRPTYDDPVPPSQRVSGGFMASPGGDRISMTGSTTPAGTETPPPMLPYTPNPAVLMFKKLTGQAKDLYARKPMVAIGVAGGAGLFLALIVIIAVASSGPSKKELAAAASASASAMAAMQTDAPPAITPARVTTPPPSLGDPEPMPAQIEMSANAPVRSVNLGSRTVEMEVPAPNVAVELTTEEAKDAVTVSAWSVDGRNAKGTWNPSDGSALTLAFGDAPAPAPAPAAAAKPHGGAKGGVGFSTKTGGTKNVGKPKHL